MRGLSTIALGQRLSASTIDIAERTPKRRASYEAAHTTPRLACPPTRTGLPRSAGSSRCSTDGPATLPLYQARRRRRRTAAARRSNHTIAEAGRCSCPPSAQAQPFGDVPGGVTIGGAW